MKKGLIILLVAVLAVGNVFFFMREKPAASTGSKLSQKYPLLARRIFSENPSDILLNFTPVRKIVEDKFQNSTIPHSVYFEYLPTGTTVRDKAETQLIAASLVKLPLVMNMYYMAEKGKIDLNKNIQLTAEDLDPGYGDLYKKGVGYTLSLRDAAKIALTESDNTAAQAINHNTTGLIPTKEEALYMLDIDYDTLGSEAIFNARSYTSILTCLYFSCYLNPASSQEILAFLTHDVYNDRLTRDIPKTVQVAHKFGTYDDSSTYSDCGLFYVPKRPYILCIMMQGDERIINSTMAEVSKAVYDSVIAL